MTVVEEQQIDWGGADTDSVAAGANEVSDNRAVNGTTVWLCVHVVALLVSTGGANDDDSFEFHLEWTGGDREGSGGADEYDSEGDGDVYTINMSSDTITRHLKTIGPIAPKGTSFRLRAVSKVTGASVTVSANVTEFRE